MSYAINQKNDPIGEVLRDFEYTLNQTTATAQRVVLNPELLIELEVKGVSKDDILNLMNSAYKVRNAFYS